ncbi:Putative flippase GtrA (transmembrane translocase of bactoprenol-linked glucose) [Kytococcus aerolatus]|uniref:Putative flippase GtrA (Transmembrane translocase of bactoprenol-linked glucose) n=1 Tax=Kytococcus aerolatus TaxID=592308 RepID=A0A212T2P5_9MICO|nr:GtrA family protein [Kytococcus aerolatus]SNC60120.1 Putative flippase GtrA (transmembrane translocase of bactoprenol-linked glucose) [Kytococcus aerolatus]
MTSTVPTRSRSVERFIALRNSVWGWIPQPLRRHIPPTAVGFAMLNLCTFALDLVLLGIFHTVFHLAYPVATTVAYVIALATAFVVNRRFNFESHGDPGRQSLRYVLVVAVNYLAFILLLNSGLEAWGVHFTIARLAAGLCEAVWMYCAMRWIVFRHGNPAGTRRS